VVVGRRIEERQPALIPHTHALSSTHINSHRPQRHLRLFYIAVGYFKLENASIQCQMAVKKKTSAEKKAIALKTAQTRLAKKQALAAQNAPGAGNPLLGSPAIIAPGVQQAAGAQGAPGGAAVAAVAAGTVPTRGAAVSEAAETGSALTGGAAAVADGSATANGATAGTAAGEPDAATTAGAMLPAVNASIAVINAITEWERMRVVVMDPTLKSGAKMQERFATLEMAARLGKSTYPMVVADFHAFFDTVAAAELCPAGGSSVTAQNSSMTKTMIGPPNRPVMTVALLKDVTLRSARSRKYRDGIADIKCSGNREGMLDSAIANVGAPPPGTVGDLPHELRYRMCMYDLLKEVLDFNISFETHEHATLKELLAMRPSTVMPGFGTTNTTIAQLAQNFLSASARPRGRGQGHQHHHQGRAQQPFQHRGGRGRGRGQWHHEHPPHAEDTQRKPPQPGPDAAFHSGGNNQQRGRGGRGGSFRGRGGYGGRGGDLYAAAETQAARKD
jgi:hypothetical protein